MLLPYLTASWRHRACLRAWSPHYCNLTNTRLFHSTYLKPRQMAEVQMMSLGNLQLSQLSFGWGQEWSNEGDRRGAAGRERTPAGTVTPSRRFHASLDLENGTGSLRALICITEHNWVHDLPSEENPLTLLLLSKLWQESHQIPLPTPKNCLQKMIPGSPLNKKNKQKTSFIIQKTTAISYYSWV